MAAELPRAGDPTAVSGDGGDHPGDDRDQMQDEEGQHGSVSVSFSGPIPPPAVLSAYEAFQPGLGERLIRHYEDEAAHVRTLERRTLGWDTFSTVLGQILAFFVAISGLGLTAYAIHAQQPWVAAVLGGGTLASLVGVFLRSQRSGADP